MDANGSRTVIETLLAAGPAADPTNPLLAPWTGPYGGLPPFDRVRAQHLAPALRTAMAENLREVAAIAANPEPPTFENTIAALERAGALLHRVLPVYALWAGNLSDAAVQAVEVEMEPVLAAFGDAIVQDAALFARIAAVHAGRETAGLSAEQLRLVEVVWRQHVRDGAALAPDAKERLAAINQELAVLYTRVGQNVLADEENEAVFLTDAAELAGLPEPLVEAAAAEAATRGRPGAWAIANTRSSVEPFLAGSPNRALREQVWRMFVTRGEGGTTDNQAAIAAILRLRAERAQLLGFPTHAHRQVVDAMAKTPERAMELMEAVWTPALARAREEVADMQAVADAEGAGIVIEPWDYRYYAEKVRKERYDLDDAEVTPYLQLDLLRDGMFHMARELFGFDFRPVPEGSVPVFHPDVRVWEVTGRGGRPVGLWYFDPYARPGKRSGAWMTGYREQERMDGAVTPLVSNNSNFLKGAPGEPVLISWTDATTLFHEFGHALHGLASDVTYPTLSGTNVARDYVEFPSQLLEHWLSTPEILSRYALHVRTGKPIPDALVERIRRAERFNEGFRTVEFLGSALVDMKLHLAGDRPIDPAAFERETLAALGMPREIVMRHRTPQFLHIFSGDGYSAAYYSYLWSDTITADAWEAFTEAGGAWDRAVGERLIRHVFSVGNTIDPADAYRAFRGRDPRIGALMRKRGFPVPPEA